MNVSLTRRDSVEVLKRKKRKTALHRTLGLLIGLATLIMVLLINMHNNFSLFENSIASNNKQRLINEKEICEKNIATLRLEIRQANIELNDCKNNSELHARLRSKRSKLQREEDKLRYVELELETCEKLSN